MYEKTILSKQLSSPSVRLYLSLAQFQQHSKESLVVSHGDYVEGSVLKLSHRLVPCTAVVRARDESALRYLPSSHLARHIFGGLIFMCVFFLDSPHFMMSDNLGIFFSLKLPKILDVFSM